jgi:hypothetical protein
MVARRDKPTEPGRLASLSPPSFRGEAEGREPGIHTHRRWLWIPGSRANGPAPRNDRRYSTEMRFSARQTLKPARDSAVVSFRHLPCQPVDEILDILEAVEPRGAGHVRRQNDVFEREQLVVAAPRLLVERVEREAAEPA